MAYKYEILIVDDVSENIQVAISILKKKEYNFSFALNAKQAIEIIKTKRFDLMLLDVMMPEIDGFALAKMIKNTDAIKDTPIIFLTAKVDIESVEEGFNLGAVDYVTKPFHPIELKSRVANHLELYRYRRELSYNNKKLTKDISTARTQYLSELDIAQKEIIFILTDILEADSGETACHVRRVAYISRKIALLDGYLGESEIEILSLAAPLHDIGKILITNEILHKPGKLTDEEFTIMKEHPAHAIKILKKSDREIIKAARSIAYEHHENYDGSGYPQGLKGQDIHIYARIVAIADVLDALTHERSYKDAWSFEEAARHIIKLSGTKFDPHLIQLFSNNLESFKEIIEGDSCL
ncbi:response regulator [Sulfurimonas sp. SAG-AH-194-C20]|nr:HD domain-containing phosphohydrolase [Sulfurimonas sp. SAG-AH-194-C20]MDF1878674.1 response regulator [Sulfurimonas sp. SAG-AH-194-C20]